MMLTSGDQPGDVSRCERLGIAAYLMKPIKQSELLDSIVLALGVTAAEDEGPEGAVVRRPTQLPPLRVLLAEDSLVNQKVAVALLEREGHTVFVANNGREAVAAFESQGFDLVLMDVQMPEMDGFEATATIRGKEQQTGRHVPIIAMTAHALKGDRERCLEAGMDNYVAKPIHAERLFETMKAAIGDIGPPKTEREAALVTTDEVFQLKEALDAVGGDSELLRVVMEAALEEAPRCMAAIRKAVTNSDAEALRQAAHKLKGAIRYFGDTSAFNHAFDLEMIGQEGNVSRADETVGDLEKEMAHFTIVLTEFVQRDNTPGEPPRDR
jgi:CheY-like chemotaxis protein